jgi:hypothetical protein
MAVFCGGGILDRVRQLEIINSSQTDDCGASGPVLPSLDFLQRADHGLIVLKAYP